MLVGILLEYSIINYTILLVLSTGALFYCSLHFFYYRDFFLNIKISFKSFDRLIYLIVIILLSKLSWLESSVHMWWSYEGNLCITLFFVIILLYYVFWD